MVTMRSKQLVLIFTGLLGLFVALNYVLWTTCTQDIITDAHYDGGDLSRMGYIRDSKMFRHNNIDLPNRHIPLNEYKGQHIDLITIGDSFSQGGGGGKNRYYQDYIATLYNLSVLNLEHYKDVDFISTISLFLNNGFIDQVKPRYVLIGATERGMMDMAGKIDFNKSVDIETMRKYKLYPHMTHPPNVPFINNGNFKMLINGLFFKFRDHGLFSDVHVADLRQNFFSVKDGSKLLYLPYKPRFNAHEVRALNDNMNLLADRLRAKGIELIYMPYVDKHTLYSKWLVHRKFPESTFFELLRPLPKRYTYIDTKALLREELEKGELDIFYADDTHSSWKASRKIFSTIRFPR